MSITSKSLNVILQTWEKGAFNVRADIDENKVNEAFKWLKQQREKAVRTKANRREKLKLKRRYNER